MEKKCPNCGNPMPEEAAFCLKCFYSIGDSAEPKEEEDKKKKAFLFPWLKQHGKNLAKGAVAMLAFLLIMSVCILAMKSMNSGEHLKPENDTTIIKETSTVAVTDTDGEAVTDEAGEQVFDVVDVTKIQTIPVSTTKKQGLLDKIFNSVSQKDDNKTEAENNKNTTNGKTPETTEKKDFFDQLIDSVLGDNEKDESTTDEKTTTEEYGTTQTTTSPSSTTTQKPSTNSTTLAPTTTSGPDLTTTTPSIAPSNDFEYTLSTNYATITKYIGDSANVIIPAVIEGKAVTRITSFAFSDNSSVKTVSFATDNSQPYLWLEPQTFNNCVNLKKITFPDTDLGIMNNFALNCLSIESLDINNAQYKYIDGSLYYNSGSTWKLRWHCPASSAATITLPSYCTAVESSSNLKEAKNVITINIHKNVVTLPHPSILPPNCENIFVDDGNQKAFDINGIAFCKESDMWTILYPAKNKTNSLTLPENTRFYGQYINNAYLETLYIPKTTKIHSVDRLIEQRMFTSLKKLYIQEGHSETDYILKNSTIPNTAKY